MLGFDFIEFWNRRAAGVLLEQSCDSQEPQALNHNGGEIGVNSTES